MSSKKRKFLAHCCCMCKRDDETVSHFLIHGYVVREIWSSIFALFRIAWMHQGGLAGVLGSWRGGRVRQNRRKAWLLEPLCLM